MFVDCIFSVVSSVHWALHYELHATMSTDRISPEISLIYCATVDQLTGEDWNNVALTLSTLDTRAHTLLPLSIPTLQPLKIALETSPTDAKKRLPGFERYEFHALTSEDPFVVPAPIAQMHFARRVDSEDVVIETAEEDAVLSSDLSPVNANVENGLPGPVIDRHALSLAYHVGGAVSVPSDGEKHRIAFAGLALTADVRYVCVPRKGPEVFLEARMKNTSGHELLPGPVTVFIDDCLAARSSLKVSAVPTFRLCVSDSSLITRAGRAGSDFRLRYRRR